MSIRWKIALLCMFTATLPLLFLNRHSVRVFDLFSRKALEEQMIDTAYIVGQEYRLEQKTGEQPGELSLSARLIRYQQESGTRFQLLATNGVVFADSSTNAPAIGKSLTEFREVRKAMDGAYGARSTLTGDRRYMYYFTALPVRNAESNLVAIVYASRHTGQITRTIIGMAENFRLAILLTLLIAGAASILLAHTLTRRLRRLSRAVQQYTRGDSQLTVEDRGRDEIAELAKSFAKMAEEIEHKNQYNRDFLADTAHELKTPLTAIKGSVELLTSGAGEQPESRAKFMANIEFETERLARMVTQLAEMTRLDTEAVRGHKTRVNYVEFLQSALERLKPVFDEPHAKVYLKHVGQDWEVSIMAERIEQVLSNLLENAIRYTPDTGRIEVSVEVEGEDRIVTTVRDNGRGIDPSDVHRVFDRFFTTEPKNQVKDFGSGLGLAIARSIVENHGGEIWVDSEPGQGAAFQFSLPRA